MDSASNEKTEQEESFVSWSQKSCCDYFLKVCCQKRNAMSHLIPPVLWEKRPVTRLCIFHIQLTRWTFGSPRWQASPEKGACCLPNGLCTQQVISCWLQQNQIYKVAPWPTQNGEKCHCSSKKYELNLLLWHTRIRHAVEWTQWLAENKQKFSTALCSAEFLAGLSWEGLID